jgi:hypothetical protein
MERLQPTVVGVTAIEGFTNGDHVMRKRWLGHDVVDQPQSFRGATVMAQGAWYSNNING